MSENFTRLYYAQCWEDPLLNQKALEVRPGDTVLGICSAGDNVLMHLVDDPARVVAIDFNLVQLRLTRLKLAAIQELSREQYLAFAGFRSDDNREALFRQIQNNLDKEDKTWWLQRIEMIREGIIHQGKFDRFFSLFRRRILPLMHSRRRVDELLREKSEDQQRWYYDQKWNTWRWKLMFRLFFNRRVISRSGRSEAHFAQVEDGDISSALRTRAERVLAGQQPWNNPYLQYIFRGIYPDENCLPDYVKPENYELIRERLDRLELRQGDLGSILEAMDDQSVQAWNLSDIFEYLPKDEVVKLGKQIYRTSSGGARLSYWNLLVQRRLSEYLPEYFAYRKQLSDQLWQKDRAFVYGSYITEYALK